MTAAVTPRSADGGLRWPTAVRLATVGGRADRTRIALTAAGAAAATLALLAAITVATTGANDGPYTSDLLNQPGLHPGIVVALVLLCVPLLAFTGQCSRVGAPARDRRLATLRLVGATPAEVDRVAAAETGLAALLGSVIGLGLYLGGRVLLGNPVVTTYSYQHDEVTQGGFQRIIEEVTGPALRLPTDVLPSAWAIALVVAALPALAAGFALVALRRVATTPFGVVRRRTVRPVQMAPAALFVAGTTGMALFATLARVTHLDRRSPGINGVVLLVLLLVTLAGLLLGTAALSSRIGRLVAGRSGRPAWVIAGRRLVAEPYAASRANAALLVVVLLAAAAQGYRADLLADVRGYDNIAFYADALDLVNLAFMVAGALAAAAVLVGLVERAVSGRRTTAALAATGVPRGVLARAAVLEVLLPVVPATLLATTAGILAARGILGTTVDSVVEGANGELVHVVTDVPVPWTPLAVIAGAALAGTALIAAVAVPLVRRAADPGELRTE